MHSCRFLLLECKYSGHVSFFFRQTMAKVQRMSDILTLYAMLVMEIYFSYYSLIVLKDHLNYLTTLILRRQFKLKLPITLSFNLVLNTKLEAFHSRDRWS